jgi:general secretion pathway protein D
MLFTAFLVMAFPTFANDSGDAPSRAKPAPQPDPAPITEPDPQEAAPRGAPAPQPPSAATDDEENSETNSVQEVIEVPEPIAVDVVVTEEPIEEILMNQTATGDGFFIFENSSVNRRATDEELVHLNISDERIELVLKYIVEWTGKTVMVRMSQLSTTKITLIKDGMVTKHEALDLLFQAFRLNGVGVVETDKVIMIDVLDKTNLQKLQPPVVLGPEVNIRNLREDGNIIIKVFKIKEAKALDIYERLNSSTPDYATFTADANSNQLILEGDIGLAKRFQNLIDVLDVPPFIAVKTETFRLAYADAQTVSEVILELFSPSPTSGSSGARRTTTNTRGQRGPSQQANQSVPQVGTSEQLQVSVLPQTNSVTVRAEPDILTDIRFLIENSWDIPPSQDGNIFRLYDLEYTDPVKVKNLLSALLETGGGSSGGARGGAGRQGAASGGADIAVADIFRIEAYPDSNRLVIISKTPDNFIWLDRMINEIDQPLSVGMPVNIELKHASAIEVADILNALLAQSGGGGRGIQAPQEGLGGINFETAGTGGESGAAEGGTEEITFPWQSGRGAGADESAEVSGLVGKSRVVPNPGQNSLLVLATPEIQTAVLQIISDLDRPGRQVMITAVLAEVTLGDVLDLGIRVGRGISATGDNTLGGGITLDLGKNAGDTPNAWFNTAVLGVNTDVNFVLQALAQDNETRILQRPRVFTSDNKEAVFFSGQDVTFQTGQTTGDGGGTTSSFEQRAVGVGVNVRPRITAEKNVAMQIQVLLSNINSADLVNNNPVVDRREATTTITIKNEQTIVISGIRVEEESDVLRKVPLLGDIPILGNLFQSTEKEKGVRELLIFITPVVVENPDENDMNFNASERERLKDLSQPLDELEEKLRKNDDFFDNLDSENYTPVGSEKSD